MLKLQVERQENHTARLSVELDAARFETAMQQAARKLSNRLNIPGFRKGKAPYRIVLKYVGEEAIKEEAVELLVEDVYKEALPNAGIEPYGSVAFEEVKYDPAPTFVYVLPLQPEVSLGAYREVRIPYTLPEIEDAAVDRSLRQLQEQQAVIEDSSVPVALGNRVTMDIHSFFVEEHEHVEGDDEADEEDHDHEEGEEHDHDLESVDPHHGEHFIHEHDFQTLLNEDYEPVPGFNDTLVGMNAGDTKEFELSFPETEEDAELRGRKVKFEVTIKKVEQFTMPQLNDELAARITATEEKPLTLLELRVRTRQNLVEANERRYKSQYANEALQQMIQGATLEYPEDIVRDEIEQALQRFDQQLQQQNQMTLRDYVKLAQIDGNMLYQQFRPAAIRRVEQTLVLRELLRTEQVDVSEERLNEEIEKVVMSYDENVRDQFRQLFQSPEMRASLLDDLLTNTVMDRVVVIAKGEAPELPAPVAETPAEESSEAAAPAASDQPDVQGE